MATKEETKKTNDKKPRAKVETKPANKANTKPAKAK